MDEANQLAEAAIIGASSDTLRRRALLSLADWTTDLFAYLGRAREDGLAGVSTGLRDLNRMTPGLSTGLYSLAASTGTGKTALAGRCQWARPSRCLRLDSRDSSRRVWRRHSRATPDDTGSVYPGGESTSQPSNVTREPRFHNRRPT